MGSLVTLEPKGRIVFAGDTHGDSDSSKYILDKYLKEGCKIVFLGDYVDRGTDNIRNIEILFNARERNPGQVHLLRGNHEGYMTSKFPDASFWERLEKEDKIHYSEMFSPLPIAVSAGPIIALHGALPDLKSIEEIDKLEPLEEGWNAIIWGDFVEGAIRPRLPWMLRPHFQRSYFENAMQQLNKQVLIRSHDSSAPLSMYDGRCVTIYSTNDIERRMKSVAIADFNQHPDIRSIDDLVIEEF